MTALGLLLSYAVSARADVVVFRDGAIEPFGAAVYTGAGDNLIVWSTAAGVADRNYGGHADVFVGFSNGLPRRALFRFDVSSLDGRFEKINSVTLRLGLYDKVVNFSNSMDLYRLSADNQSWVEGTATGQAQVGSACWNHLAYHATSPTPWHSGTPGTAASDYVPGGPIASTAYDATTPTGYFDLTFTDTSFIADWAASYAENSGLLLRARTEANNSLLYFRSSEFTADQTMRPQLIIDYDPVIPPAAATVLATNPAAYWRLNETKAASTAVDATGNGHNFTYNAAPGVSRTGSPPDVGPRPDQGFSGFESFNNAPTLAATPIGMVEGLLTGQNDYGAQMWFRPGDSVHPSGHYLLHRGTGSNDGDYLGVLPASDTLYFYDGTGGALPGSTTLTKGQWYHVAMTREGSAVKVYLDGQEEISVSRDPKAGLTTGQWAFGGRSDTPPAPVMHFTGNIDEIAVYGRPLGKFHVQASYLSAFARDVCDYSNAVLADNPAAYWRLNEGPQWVAAMDSSGNSHHFEYHASAQRGAVELGPRPSVHHLGFENDNPAPRLTGGPTGSVTNGYLGIATGVLPGQNDYTAEMWFRRDAVGTIGAYLMHRNDLDATGGVVKGDFLGLRPADGETRLFVYDGSYPYITLIEGSTDLLQDEWYHVAMVRQDDDVFVYLNGRLEIEGTMAPLAGTKWVDGTWAFGGRTDAPSLDQRFAGSLDEIAIYGRALSQEEIRAHYLVGVPEPSAWMLLALGGLCLAGGRPKRHAI
jgi:hypothetical protein